MFRFTPFPVLAWAIAVAVLVSEHVSVANAASASASIMPSFLKKKTYTPLLFFKVPLGTMDECEYRNYDMHFDSDFRDAPKTSHAFIRFPTSFLTKYNNDGKATKWKA